MLYADIFKLLVDKTFPTAISPFNSLSIENKTKQNKKKKKTTTKKKQQKKKKKKKKPKKKTVVILISSTLYFFYQGMELSYDYKHM